MLTPRTDQAIEFLRQFRPDGPWVLTAIIPDTSDAAVKTDTRTFRPKDEAELKRWLDGYQGIRNLYFMVNPAKSDLNKKAEKTDVVAAEWLYIDVDPRAGEDIEIERQRALKVVPDKIKQKATICIDSGGGFQFFWKLADSFPLDNAEKIAQAEAYNRQLVHLTQADKNCFNVDRIMRLPGTINVPTKTKIKKGRVPVLASLVFFEAEQVHALSGFTQAANVANLGERGGPTRLAVSTGNLPKVDLDELAETFKLPAKLMSVIVRGEDLSNPLKHGSRSEWLWYVCCELARNSVPPETMLAIIMDPDFLISASVLDKPRPERYALKQVEDALEKAESSELHELNQTFAVIGDIGGKCRIISEITDEAMGGRRKITRQTFEDFRNRFMHRKVCTGRSEKGLDQFSQLGKWWLEHAKRRQYERMVFLPGQEGNPANFNLWRGFACEAIPGDCQLFLDHLFENICGGVQEYYDYLIRWLAKAVQFPDRPGEVAVILRGKQGTGKSLFAKVFGSLWGQHFLQVADPKFLVGSFNAHLRDCVVLFGDEAFYAGDKKHESVLKMLVTEELITIEAKGIDAEAAPNYTHIILASNDQWVVPAGMDDRRFFVLDVSDKHAKDTVYFGKLWAQLNSGGREALLHHLLTFDLGSWKVQAVPQTEALREQKLHSLGAEYQWWYERLDEGTPTDAHAGWEEEVSRKQLHDDYLNFAQARHVFRPMNRIQLGLFMSRVLGSGFPKEGRVYVWEEDQAGKRVKKSHNAYRIPPLAECRAAYDKVAGGPYPWTRIQQVAKVDHDNYQDVPF